MSHYVLRLGETRTGSVFYFFIPFFFISSLVGRSFYIVWYDLLGNKVQEASGGILYRIQEEKWGVLQAHNTSFFIVVFFHKKKSLA